MSDPVDRPGRRLPHFTHAALLLALAVGVWARVRGLGVSSLANDEYYFVLSIQQILEHGIPWFETGGLYTRGILVQYLTAPFMLLIEPDEVAVRIPSVVFGLATAGVAWWYGRRTVGPKYAALLVVFLLVSSWQVEFSRFGRMYAAFQLLTLAMLTALYETMTGTSGIRRYLVPLLLAAALLTHQLALLLIPLVFLPLLIPGARDRLGGRRGVWGYGMAAAGTLVLGWFSRAFDFRQAGVTDIYPAGYSAPSGTELLLPYFPFWRLSPEPAVNVAFVALALALAAGVSLWLARRSRTDAATGIAALMLVTAAAHLLLVAFALGLVLVLRYGVPWKFREHRAAAVLWGSAAAVSVGWAAYATWLTYGAGARGWIHGGGFTLFREAAVAAFVWPNPWHSVIAPWLAELPVTAWMIGAAVLLQVLLAARRPVRELVLNPAFVVLYCLAVFGLFDPLYGVTRYTFFLYPVGLALVLLSIRDLGSLVANRLPVLESGFSLGLPAAILVFAIGGDFHPRHLLHVDAEEAVLRSGEFREFEATWYARDDFASPARFLQEEADATDPIIVQEAPSVSYYLNRPHGIYLDRSGDRFSNVSRHGGTVDFWSGERLLSTEEDVRSFTRCAREVWLVRMADQRAWVQPDSVWASRLTDAKTVFEGRDGAVEVLRIEVVPEASCPEPEE